MRFSQFFIDRPIFAAVLSLVIVIAGAHRAASSCRSASTRRSCRRRSSCAPPIPGANPKVIAETVAVAARAADQRRRGHALHVLAGDRRRRDDADDHVRARHRPRQRAGAGAEPRGAGAAAACRAKCSASASTTEKASPDFIMVVHLVSPDERYDMLYLSNYAHLQVQRRAGAHRRRRQRRRCSAPANTACASGSIRTTGLAAADGDRRGARDPRAERAGGRRRARRAAGADRHRVPAVGQRAGPARSPRRSSRTSSCAPRRTGRSRACSDVARVELGLEPLRAAQPARQPAGRGDRHLPAPGHQRARSVERGARDDGGAEEVASRKASTTASSTTRRSSCASRSTRSSRRCSRRSCWS